MKRIFLLLLLWACWCFTLGTLVLIGPLRWTVNWGRSQHWTEGQERIRVYILMLLLAVISFFVAKATAAFLTGENKRRLRGFVFLVPLLSAGFSAYAFMNPRWINHGSDEAVGQQFTIGPYPEKEKLQALKDDHFTAVISLLHPAVVPFEPKLMADEQAAAKAVGLPVINVPLLPWVSDNMAALDSLRTLVKKAKGKVYVHCYLGKDRVNLARRIIEQEVQGAGMEEASLRSRSLDTVQAFERGPVYKLDEGIYFTPFPTKEEYVGYILATNCRQVVSLADLSEPGAKELMEEEKKTLAGMRIPFQLYHFSAKTTPLEMKALIAKIKALPKPVVVHPFFTGTKEAALFRQLYNR